MAPTTEKIAVLGAGQMGNGIAHVFAQSGFSVTMIDVAIDAHRTADVVVGDVGPENLIKPDYSLHRRKRITDLRDRTRASQRNRFR